MSNEFVGKFTAFKGDENYVPQENLLLEVTEVKNDRVEIAFNAPIPGKPRVYLSFSIAELIKQAMESK